MKLEVLRQMGVRPTCHVCKFKWFMGNLQWDHVLALVDGGTHTVDNLRPICIDCHKRKSAYEHKENCRAKRRAKKHRPKSSPETAKGRAGSEGQDAQANGHPGPGEHRHSKRSWPSRKMKSRPFGKDTRI